MLITFILILHIIGAAVLFGTGMGTAFYMLAANRSRNITFIAKATQLVVKADWIFTGTAGILQPITGALLVYLKGYHFADFWVWGSILGYVIAGGFWLPVVYFQIALGKIANQALAKGTALPPRYHSLYRAWFWCGWPAFLSLIGVFFLMSTGPT
ncbi:MAG: DUF2269 domain-containing protein [Gammaproteobacteria bacterium]|jgi:uncharacterized membrane protein|nr:DUF2269 domain-containing protein [Gammaproteobacteria bacterium]